MKKIIFTLTGLAFAISALGATGEPISEYIAPPDTNIIETEEYEIIKANQDITEMAPPPPPSEKTYKESGEERPLTIAERMPKFRGNLDAWIASHLQYPAEAAECGVQGRVIVRFVVEKDGSITNASVIRSVEPSVDREALRIVNSMPLWIPGMNNGHNAAVWYTCPITFKLQ